MDTCSNQPFAHALCLVRTRLGITTDNTLCDQDWNMSGDYTAMGLLQGRVPREWIHPPSFNIATGITTYIIEGTGGDRGSIG